MIALLASCNISILIGPFFIGYCFNLTCISRIYFSCRIIVTAFLNFSQIENFASGFNIKSHSIFAKFTIKVTFTSESLPSTSTETVGHSFSHFHKNPGPSNHRVIFSNSNVLILWNSQLQDFLWLVHKTIALHLHFL